MILFRTELLAAPASAQAPRLRLAFDPPRRTGYAAPLGNASASHEVFGSAAAPPSVLAAPLPLPLCQAA